jgi:hypothetical protein
MATLQEETKARLELKGVLADLAKMKASDLARKDLGQDLSFEEGALFFSRTLRLFQALNEADLEDVSYQKITQIMSVAVQSRDLFRNVAGFSVGKYSSNPISQRDSFINQARDQYDNIFDIVSPAIAFTVRKGTDFARLEEQAKETLARMNEMSKAHEQTTKTTLENAEQVIKEVRRIAEEAGVSQHSSYFKNEADRNEGNAIPWLTWTIALASVTIVISLGLSIRYFFVLPTLTPSQSVQLAIPKLFLFSVLLSATVWTGKTYRAYATTRWSTGTDKTLWRRLRHLLKPLQMIPTPRMRFSYKLPSVSFRPSRPGTFTASRKQQCRTCWKSFAPLGNPVDFVVATDPMPLRVAH